MTEINNTELKQLLLKEQQGRLSTEEQEKLNNWYNSFDITHHDLSIFRDNEHEAATRQRLFNRIINTGFPSATKQHKSIKYKIIFQWASAAAILITVIVAAIFWKSKLNFRENETSAFVQTGVGSIKKIMLDDGSQIWLNAGSKLCYPKHFGSGKRMVYLEGEAFFDIAHDPQRPFTVQTDFLTTHVLGTAFSVTAYKNMPSRIVTVIRGKVQVTHQNLTLGFLTPDKRIEYRVKDGKSCLTEIEAAAVMSWIEGKLQFINQDMQDITARLGRWYGYSFRFEHSNIQNCRYTASFNSQIPLANLLKVMKAISLVKYDIDTTSKTVTF